jgi:hypothetical protein
MFRFTIRELVLLTLVVAMGVGWWLDRTRLTDVYDPRTRLEATVFRVHDFEKLADVALGYDDGVAVGDRLDVYRSDARIGEIKLLEISPDTSRGAISNQDAPILKGDKASIYLRLSDFQRRSRHWMR